MSRFQRRLKRKQQKGSDLRLVPSEAIVSLCVPSDDHVHAMFYISSLAMMMNTMNTENSGVAALTVQHIGSSLLPHSRYTLVKKSQAQKATHLLFIDSDMSFPPDTIMRLLSHNVDMVGVNAMSRRPPYHSTAWVKPGKRCVTSLDSTGLEKVWRTGYAVIMIRAEVFDALAAPYFNYEFIPETDDFRGEDYYFFDRAREAGFDLWVDHDLSKEVNHIGCFAFNPMLAAQLHPMATQSEESAEKQLA